MERMTRLFTIALCMGAGRVVAAQHVAPVAAHHEATSVRALSSRMSVTGPKDFDDGRGPLYVAMGALLGAGTAAYVTFHGVHWSDDGMIVPVMPFVEIGAAGVVGGLLGWMIHDAKQS